MTALPPPSMQPQPSVEPQPAHQPAPRPAHQSPGPAPAASDRIALTLVPGARVLRRERGVVEVRLGTRAVRAPDSTAVRALLGALREHRPPAPRNHEAADLLGALADAHLLAEVAPSGGSPLATALAARAGLQASERVARRHAVRVAVEVDPALTEAERLRADAVAALQRAAVPPLQDRRAAAREADLALLVLDHAAPPEAADAWTALGVPHLALTLAPDGCVLGPFVVPGVTACLHCLEAHRRDGDPRHRLLRERGGAGAAPAPDPALLAWGLAAAAADLARAAEGDLPRSWSRSIPLRHDPDPVDAGSPQDLAPTHWWRHPACGCAWG